MTPELTSRSFSNDQAVFDTVFFNNIYKIKGNKEIHRSFVDIGAHAGFFSFLALSLGARKVYAFEPYIDSFSLLLKNCYNPHFVGRFTPYQLGIHTNAIIGKFEKPNIVDGIYFDFASIGLSIKPDDSEYPCNCETLDAILQTRCFNERIDILKINIGYAEREILLGSEILPQNVRAICGEITANDVQLTEFKKQMGIKGFINFISETPKDNDRVIFRAAQDSLSEYFV